MPIITLEAHKLTKEQKIQLAKQLTEAVSKIIGVPETSISILVKENEFDNISVGGQLLSETIN